MSVLSDRDLHAAILERRLSINPLGDSAVQPNSVDLRLHPHLRVATPDGFRDHHLVDDGPLRLHQHMFVLGATLEWVEVADDLVGFLWGKSSRAREGIQVHSAGLVDSGWRGNLTLEISMLSPLSSRLMVGMQIAQLQVSRTTSRCDTPYGSPRLGSRYQDSHGPVESRGVVGGPS